MTANDRKRPILPGTGGGDHRRWWRGTGGVALRIKDRKHLTCPSTMLRMIPLPRWGGTTAPHPKADTPKFVPSSRHAKPVPALALPRINRLIGAVQQFLDTGFAAKHRDPDPDRRLRQAVFGRGAGLDRLGPPLGDDPGGLRARSLPAAAELLAADDRQSLLSGKSVSVRVALGGLRILLTNTSHPHF